jgi:pimeloyl-ACP methyl ester carboxylesterase
VLRAQLDRRGGHGNRFRDISPLYDGQMNLPILLMMAYWAYKSFGIMGVLGFPLMMLAMLYFRQNGMLYVNSVKSYAMTPDQAPFNLSYEEVRFITSDGFSICSWLVKQPKLVKGRNLAPTCLFFHGNAGTIAERLPNVAGLVNQCGVNVMLVEYRGYGTSEGTPTEAGLLADAQAALEALQKRDDIDSRNVFVFGRSLGGAVAVALAHANPGALRGLIVENTFTCIREMAGALFPFLLMIPATWCEALLENHWHSDEIIASLKLPSLFLGGRQDEIVPTAQMDELWSRFTAAGTPERSELVMFETGKHNDTWTLPGYYTPLEKFFRAVDRRSGYSKPGSSDGGATGDGGDLSRGWVDLDYSEMAVSDIKAHLRRRGVAHSQCVEKAELVALMKNTIASSKGKNDLGEDH